jgi:hypothetical protein
MLGLMSLLTKHRSSIINDIEDMQSPNTSRLEYLNTMNQVLYPSDLQSPTHMKIDFLTEEYHGSLEHDFATQKILINAHLRRMRNFYVVLMEVCERDEKLLAW